MMRRRTSHSVGALLLLLVARGAPSAGSPASGTLARPRLEGSASGRPREPQAAFGRRQATSGAQLLKLLAGDGVAYSQFGISVAVSSDGARVVVGAGGYYDDDELGSQFGSAYVLDGATGERLLKLVASDGAQFDSFGYSVAVSSDGARVVVGSVYDDDQASTTGSAYVFNGTTGERLLKLVASDGAANDYFGDSVAVSSDGARVVVGATGDDDQGANSGSAYVLDGATGERLFKLVASDGAAGDSFGYSVSVSSDGARVVVGATGDDDQGTNSGSAYVFDGTTGERLLKLVASDAAAYSKFGNSVAVSSDGARVVVGACQDDDQGVYSGSAYVLDGTTGERLLKLVASDGAQLDRFGYSVAVSSDGARVVVGSFYDSDQGTAFGSAYVFNGTTGERLLKLVASDGAANDYFGDSVAVSSDGARVVVGAMNDDDQGTNSGSAYVFDFTETTTETTTATTTKTATTTTDTGMSSDTSNTTATTEPWGLIAVFAGVLILFLVCCVALGCLVKRRRGRSPRPERGIDNAEVKDNEYNESEQVAEI
ncbi:unnamed protein product [Prorocentrum cordatum]|uniref:Uncharacterized protein n=1 Tax=Prorocentrum cordatum TaxID=2364126 RepID=A0ABN9RIV0_9DINO|nr:unnamed protein product [Polarella glacialis]